MEVTSCSAFGIHAGILTLSRHCNLASRSGIDALFFRNRVLHWTRTRRAASHSRNMQISKSPARPQSVPSKAQTGHRSVVLVVDDDKAVADSLAFMLRHAGYETHAAYSFRQAAADATSLRPDVMVADIRLPDGNGIDLAVQIRKVLASCKILLFSGDVESNSLVDQSRFKGHNFQFVEKPIHPQDLILKLRWL